MLLLGKTGEYDVIITEVGGTMRLGAYKCRIEPGTLALRIYGVNEIIELPSHPFFIATQFHPEYKSTPERPHLLFVSFVDAAKEHIPPR